MAVRVITTLVCLLLAIQCCSACARTPKPPSTKKPKDKPTLPPPTTKKPATNTTSKLPPTAPMLPDAQTFPSSTTTLETTSTNATAPDWLKTAPVTSRTSHSPSSTRPTTSSPSHTSAPVKNTKPEAPSATITSSNSHASASAKTARPAAHSTTTTSTDSRTVITTKRETTSTTATPSDSDTYAPVTFTAAAASSTTPHDLPSHPYYAMITHNGTFYGPNSSDLGGWKCYFDYIYAFRNSFNEAIRQAQQLIATGKLCNFSAAANFTLQPGNIRLDLHSNTGRVQFDTLVYTSAKSLPAKCDADFCALYVSLHIQSLSSWPNPIIGGIPRCEDVTFSPPRFDYHDARWLCLSTPGSKEHM